VQPTLAVLVAEDGDVDLLLGRRVLVAGRRAARRRPRVRRTAAPAAAVRVRRTVNSLTVSATQL